jgi:hypothetical protein
VAAAAGILVLVVVGGVQVRGRLAERDLERRVVLTASLGVEVSSTSPPGGQVRYAVRVRNGGPRPLVVTSVRVPTGRLRLHLDDGQRRVDAGHEVSIPISVRLTCPAAGLRAPRTLRADVGVRRADGRSAAVRLDLAPARLLLDVAATLCSARPGLRDYELSGPIARTR